MASRVVFLTRHGATDWNHEGRWQGHTDIPLNEKGRAQARGVAEALRDAGIVAIASSDLRRAHETACIVGETLGLEVAYVDAGLRERMCGIFEGLTREDCERLHPAAWRAWLEDQTPPPGFEDPGIVAQRVTEAIGRAAKRLATDGAPALIVTHGGALRAAVTSATGHKPGPIANCAIWRIEWDDGIVRAEMHAVERVPA
jgi:probable phosphoglycerate mutase